MRGFTKLLVFLMSRGFKIKFHMLDNRALATLKRKMKMVNYIPVGPTKHEQGQKFWKENIDLQKPHSDQSVYLGSNLYDTVMVPTIYPGHHRS